MTGEAGSGCGPTAGQGCAKLEPGPAGVGTDGPGELSWSTEPGGPGKASQAWWGHWGTGSCSLAKAITFRNGSSTRKVFRKKLVRNLSVLN